MTKTLDHAGWEALVTERDRLRASGLLAGIGVASCLEPSGGNSSFEPLLNAKNTTTTWMESCRIMVDALGTVTITIHTTSSGQGHETLAATVAGEALQIDPDRIRVVRATSLESLPGNSPVGSRMAIMLGGAVHHAAGQVRDKLMAIAAHRLGVAASTSRIATAAWRTRRPAAPSEWIDLVSWRIAISTCCRPACTPASPSSHIMQVPTGDKLPTADGRVQMYPCFSFEFHVVLVAIDPEIGKPEIRRYVIGHDCGTVINPDIVRGMTLGGIAHGIGAALLEEFAFDGEGQLVAQSFMDYLLPSAHEVPEVEIVHHVTPSPHTVLGQKGSGKSGYLGSPAALSGAINDAVRHLNIRFEVAAHAHLRHRRRHCRRDVPSRPRRFCLIIDSHAHLVPPALLEAIRSEAARFPSVRAIEDHGSLAFSFAGAKPTRPVSKPLSDIAGRVAWMTKNGIDKQVVGGWVDMFGYELPAAEGTAWAQLINSQLAAAAKAEPRFVPLATVPLQDGAAAAEVLRRPSQRAFPAS